MARVGVHHLPPTTAADLRPDARPAAATEVRSPVEPGARTLGDGGLASCHGEEPSDDSAAPPAKQPILTLLKQARAFGVGMALSTQNPVDLDYKAISNAGTWLIGRLQTERDRDRLLDGMRSAGGTVDVGELADTIGNLDKREFVVHSTREGAPRRFSTRWAMSYLPGRRSI